MKGMSFLWYIMLVFSFAIIMLVFMTVGTSSVKFFMGLAVQNDAELRARDVVGIVNTLESSPEYTKVVYYLPKGRCTVNITKMYVRVTVPSNIRGVHQFSEQFFIDDKCVKIANANFECSPGTYKKIYFFRVHNTIVPTENGIIDVNNYVGEFC